MQSGNWPTHSSRDPDTEQLFWVRKSLSQSSGTQAHRDPGGGGGEQGNTLAHGPSPALSHPIAAPACTRVFTPHPTPTVHPSPPSGLHCPSHTLLVSLGLQTLGLPRSPPTMSCPLCRWPSGLTEASWVMRCPATLSGACPFSHSPPGHPAPRCCLAYNTCSINTHKGAGKLLPRTQYVPG